MDNQLTTDGKTNATISYLTIIGTIVAFILNNKVKNPFASFHIRQNIGLNILYFINQWFIEKYFGIIAFIIINIILLFLWIVGFMGVINNEKKIIPIFGNAFQDWFKNL